MEIVTGCASSIARDLVCGAVNQLRYPRSFNNFVEDLQKKKDELITIKNSVRVRVDDDKKQARETDRVVHKWLEDAETYIRNVEELLEKATTNKTCCLRHCPDWFWRYRLAKKLAKKNEDIGTCIQEGRQYIRLERQASLQDKIDLHSEKYVKFESRHFTFARLMAALRDEKVKKIGLYGMEGCGKTTLAQKLSKTVLAEQLFKKVLFVAVSSTVDVRKIQDKIVSALSYSFPESETEETERARRLYTRLTMEESILVILDDVWEFLNFGIIGIPVSHKGCKILITTRNSNVCTGMDCERKIQLSVLTDKEAWLLFQKHANIHECTSNSLKDLARQISDECEGLSGAVAAVASTLKGKPDYTWRAALHRLKRSIPVSFEQGFQNPYTCLQLSYDNLDSEEAKSLFLLCSVFPEDEEIPVEYLIRFAIGLGLVGEFPSYEVARNEISTAIDKLISSSLLSGDVDREWVKMHDLVRDVALWIAKNEKIRIKCIMEKDAMGEHDSLRYLWCEKFSNELDCSNLEFLRIHTNFEVSGEIFKGMGKLKVLFLSWKVCERRLLLSSTLFKSLTNLRCLTLQRCDLGDMSFVGYMRKLESLALVACYFHDDNISFCDDFKHIVADDHIGKISREDNKLGLSKLKQLNVDRCMPLTYLFTPVVAQNLVQLEELNISSCEELKHIMANDDIEEISRDDHRLVFPKLKRLNVDKCKKLTCLFTPVTAPYFIHLEELNISSCEELKHIVADDDSEDISISYTSYSLSKSGPFNLCNLKRLTVESCPMLGSVFPPSSAKSFTSLEALSIQGCHELRYFVTCDRVHENSEDDTIHEDHDSQSYVSVFSRLKKITVRDCKLLEYIFHVSLAKGQVELKDIEIWDTPQLRYVFGQSIRDVHSSHQDQNKIEQILLPVLEKVSLGCVPSLISICPDNYYVTCSSLRQLAIDAILLSYSSITGIWNSSNIHGVFHLEGFPTNGRQVITSRLKDLRLFGLQELSYIWKGAKHSVSLQHLYKLEILRCPKLKVIFSTSVLRSLPLLKFLVVEKCDQLEQIIEKDEENEIATNLQCPDICFSRLKFLRVTQCDNLKRLLCISRRYEFPELECLIVAENSRLEEVFEVEQSIREGTEEVSLPELKFVMLSQLPNLNNVCQGIELQARTDLFVHNCPNLSPTSTTEAADILENYFDDNEIDFNVRLAYYQYWMATRETAPQLQMSPEDQSSTSDEHNQIESEATESHEFLTQQIENKETGNILTSLELKLSLNPSSNLTENSEETETNFIGKVPQSVVPTLPASCSGQCVATPIELNLATSTSVETPLHKTPSPATVAKIVHEASTAEELVKANLSAGGEGLSLGCVGNYRESIGCDIFAHDSQDFEQDDKLNESDTIQNIHNGVDSIQKGSNLTDKGEIDLEINRLHRGKLFNEVEERIEDVRVESLSSQAQINEESQKEFVEVPDSEITAVASARDLKLIVRPSQSPFDVPPRKAHLHELVDGQSMSSPCLMNQQKSLGETESTIETPQTPQTLERENRGTPHLQLLELEKKLLAIPSPNLIESIEETEMGISGEVPASVKPTLPTSGSELRTTSRSTEDIAKESIQEGRTSEEATKQSREVAWKPIP